MVRSRRVARLFAACGILAAWQAALGDDLQVTWETAERQYGKPLDLLIATTAQQPALSGLELRDLQADFVVQQARLDSGGDGGPGQRLHLRLYARQPGPTQVPGLRLGSLASAPLPVTITPARDDKDDAPISVDFDRIPGQVWLKQALAVAARIDTRTPYLSFERETATHPALTIDDISHRRESLPAGGTRHHLGWMLYAQSAENVDLQLPPLRLRRGGVITHVFYPPRSRFQVSSLPEYVPVTLPVGRITVEASLPRRVLLTDRLNSLILTARGDGVRPAELQDLRRQLAGDAWLRLYPVGEGESESDGGVSTVVFTVPFAARHSGFGGFPGLRLQYFNPDSGKIETSTLYPGRMLAIAPWFYYLLLTLFALAGLWLLRSVWRGGRRRWRSLRGYRRAWEQARRARSVADIRAALMLIAAAEAWPDNLTLQQWCRHWLRRYPGQVFIAEALTRLQAWHYGKSPDCLPAVRAAVSALCHRRYPLLRWIAFNAGADRRGG